MHYILILVVVFVAADLAVRFGIKKIQENKRKKKRAVVLNQSLTMDFSVESKSLKQAEVDDPKARILCVDDEPIILDSFRKILVLGGYSISTVESGLEAINLIKRHHYDFVFTDLKMPEMDGIRVTQAVKEIRPDIDVVIITGYATVESAVECMQYGAMDYVQKPFTEDELMTFVERALVNRQVKVKNDLKPRVFITDADQEDGVEEEVFTIPGGVFVSPGHCWASMDPEGLLKIGMDDFAKKAVGKIDDIEFPNLGMDIRRGAHLFNIMHGNRSFSFSSPVSGKVIKINQELRDDMERLEITAYQDNWICMIDADNLDSELQELMVGKGVVSFYQAEIEKLNQYIKKVAERKNIHLAASSNRMKQIECLDDSDWKCISDTYFC